jgi:hypothetical protein
MADSFAEDPLPRRPPLHEHGTLFVTVTSAHRGKFNAYANGALLCGDTYRPFAGAAERLLAIGYHPETRVIIRLSGSGGTAHEALVRPLGKLAGLQDKPL